MLDKINNNEQVLISKKYLYMLENSIKTKEKLIKIYEKKIELLEAQKKSGIEIV